MTRDASGLFVGAKIHVDDGKVIDVRRERLAGGFWLPMGVERTGPTFECLDEFNEVVSEGRPGAGVLEQGVLRQVF